MLYWIDWNRTDYMYKMELELNNLQVLISYKIQPTNQPIIRHFKSIKSCFCDTLTNFKDYLTNSVFGI